MLNNNSFQVRQLSQYFSRPSSQSQRTHTTGADLKPRTAVSRTDSLDPLQGHTVITRLVGNGFASPNYVQHLVPLKVEAEHIEEVHKH